MTYLAVVPVVDDTAPVAIVATVDADIIGRVDMIELLPGDTDKQNQLDLRPIISDAGVAPEKPQFCTEARNEPFDQADLAREMLTKTLPAIETKSGGDFDFRIHNYDRTIGASISGEVARRYGNDGMGDAPLNILLHGTAGQSFGAFVPRGLTLELHGDANDSSARDSGFPRTPGSRRTAASTTHQAAGSPAERTKSPTEICLSTYWRTRSSMPS